MKRRILSILTALALCLGLLPTWAWAAEANPVLDIANGNIFISDGQYAQVKKEDASPKEWQSYSGEITITGTSTSWYHVKITGGTHTIRLKNAAISPKITSEIYRNGCPALDIAGSNVCLILEGTSTLTGSGSYDNEAYGRESIQLGSSTLNITGNGTLNAKGGQSLRQTEASSPHGGDGITCSKSTIHVSDSATLNVSGGNMSLRDIYWGNGIYADGNSVIELSGGTASVKGMAGLDLRNSRLSQTGGTLSVEGRSGIDSTNEGYQAEVSGGVMNVHSSSRSSISRGSLTVSGGEVTLRTDYYQTAVGANASVTVKPPAGYCGIMKHGGSADSAAKTPFAEKTTLSSVSGKYVNITFSDEKHNLTVQDGGTGASGSGTYLPGQKVDIRAGTVEDKDFKWWETVSGDGSFADAGAADTTFTMGWENAVIQPVFVTGILMGDFAVATENVGDCTYADGVLTISGSGTYDISMKNPGTPTSDRISLAKGNPTVILNSVLINSGNNAAIQLAYNNNTVNATLKLSGTSKLSAGGTSAAIGVWTQNPSYIKPSLTITSLAGDGRTEGTLEAAGCVGIGGINTQGAVTINGGTIVATGNGYKTDGGYGIGGPYSDPTVTINGGDVTATGSGRAKRAFGGKLVLNNDPSIVVNGEFVYRVNNDQSVRIYYDDQGGSSVKSVTVTPQDGEVLPGNTLQFEAQVEGGGNADKTVKWSITDASSEGTTIDAATGLLTIGQDETSEALTVIAANDYSGLSGRATVTSPLPLLAPTGLYLSLPDKSNETNLDAVAGWNPVDKADGYLLQLYKNGDPVGGEVSVEGTSHHFSIDSKGAYTFKVKAVRNGGMEGPEAECDAKQIYTVMYSFDGKIMNQLAAQGCKLERPADPEKSGLTFLGWQRKNSASFWDFENDTVTSASVWLVAVWNQSYRVTVQAGEGGSASASPTTAEQGTTISLTATPDEGYHFKKWEVVSGMILIMNNSFTMPGQPVTIKAIFEKDDDPTPPQPTTYTVTAQAGTGGTASASPTTAEQGTTITLTATPDEGYHFKEWQVISGGVTISGNSFAMPAENVTVQAVFEQDDDPTPPQPTTYTVTAQAGAGGRASASPTTAEQGTTITLTATPDEGYHFKEWQVISGGVTISGNSFTMPAENVTVKAVFEQDDDPTPPQPTTYTVTAQAGTGGTASASPASATAGTTIILTATPDSGYHFKEWEVLSGGVTISVDSFTMPEGNVTVKAVFEQDDDPTPPQPTTYTVTAQAGTGGTASASPTSAEQGTTIILTATPDSGYHFKEWEVVSGGVTISGNSFTMPAENVTVKAVFEKDDDPTPPQPTTYTVTAQAGAGGRASASPTSAEQGTTIILTATPDEGYHFKEWQVISGGVTVSGSSFTMPAANVTVKAVFEKNDDPVPPPIIPVTGVRLNRSTVTLKPGEGFRLTATVEPNNATRKDVTWSSSNPTVAEVDGSGSVIAHTPGTAVITVRTVSGGHTAACTVTVEAPEHVHRWDSAWSGDSAHHWHECLADGCDITVDRGKDGFGAHVYGDEQDEDCNICGHIREVEPPEPETYTITYSANGGSGTMADAIARDGEPFTLPECGFTAPERKVFDTWHIGGTSGTSVKPGEQYTFTADTVVWAVWKDAPSKPEYTITGNVLQNGAGVPDAIVTLMRGTITVATERTDANGRFMFSGVPVGTYNLKAEKDGITKTAKQEITSGSAGLTIILPNGRTNSVVEVKNEETPPVVVGGLDQVFTDTSIYTPEDQEIVNDGGVVEFKLTVEKQDAPPEAVQIETVKKDNETVALYLDLTLTKTVTHSDGTGTNAEIPEIGTLIETIIPLPAEMQGKASYTVYRVHNGVAEPLPENSGSEYYMVSSDKTSISIFARKYSTYAIAWSDEAETPPTPPTPPTPSSPTGGGGGSSVSTYAVTIEKSEHGKVTSSRTNASSGSTVTLTVTPDSGYVLDMLTVTDGRGSEIVLTAQGDGKYTFTMPSRAVTVKAVFLPLPEDVEKPCDGGADCPSHAFTDLGTVGTWYHEAVDYVLRNGLMNGYSSTLFGPDDNLSRAQLAQILYNQAGRPTLTGGSVFTDVLDGRWYAPAVTWAAENGIVGGYGNGLFGPDGGITREQLAAMLWRYAGSPAATDKELHFTDADKASGYALEALRWAAENGVLSGYGDGRLDPGGLVTRAQAAQMLKNFFGNR